MGWTKANQFFFFIIKSIKDYKETLYLKSFINKSPRAYINKLFYKTFFMEK